MNRKSLDPLDELSFSHRLYRFSNYFFVNFNQVNICENLSYLNLTIKRSTPPCQWRFNWTTLQTLLPITHCVSRLKHLMMRVSLTSRNVAGPFWAPQEDPMNTSSPGYAKSVLIIVKDKVTPKIMFETSVKSRNKTQNSLWNNSETKRLPGVCGISGLQPVFDPRHLFAARLMAKLTTKVFVDKFPVVVFRSAFRLLEWQNNTGRHVIHVTSESGAATLSVYLLLENHLWCSLNYFDNQNNISFNDMRQTPNNIH